MVKLDFKAKVVEVCNLLNELDDLKPSLVDNLSEYDLRLSDLYHFIELHSLDAKGCCRMIKLLKEVLTKRREIKINLSLATSYEMQKQKLINKDNRKMMLSQISRCWKEENKNYEYRVYTEEELKITLGVK